MSRANTDGFKAFNLLQCNGIEIGALSNPFYLDANVIYAYTVSPDVMADQLKKNEGGVYLQRKLVYVKIPNNELTYDRFRISTPIAYLETKFIEFDFSDENMRALDLVKNSIGHQDYFEQGDELAMSTTRNRDGHHHFLVFDPESTFEMMID